jgi:transcriptional regulator with XRE-family HTH domain
METIDTKTPGAKIQRISERLFSARHEVDILELRLQKAVAAYLDDLGHGSMRDMAKRMGFTVQYLCDIRHGRRKVSEAFLERLRGLE